MYKRPIVAKALLQNSFEDIEAIRADKYPAMINPTMPGIFIFPVKWAQSV